MAKNLFAKLTEKDAMIVHDINPNATQNFVEELGKQNPQGARVEVASSVRNAAERSVSVLSYTQAIFESHSIIVYECGSVMNVSFPLHL